MALDFIELAKQLEAAGVGLVVFDQGIDTTTPVGRMLFHTPRRHRRMRTRAAI